MKWAVAPDAEQAVIGALVGWPDALPDVEKIISARSFLSDDCRDIFLAMQALHRENIRADIINLAQHLWQRNRDDLVAAIAAMERLHPISIYALDYAKSVRKAEEARRVNELGNRIVELKQPSPKHLRRLLDEYEEAAKSSASDRPKPKLVPLRQITRRNVEYDWHPFIPRHYLTLIDGDPGVRKSWLVGHITRAVTRGKGLPGDTRARAKPGRVLYLAGEEGLDDAVLPRLEDMGADLDHVIALTAVLKGEEESLLMFDPEGLAVLQDAAQQIKPELVIIDPLLAYTGGTLDSNKAGEVRALLRPLGEMARRLEFTLVCTRHLSKALTLSALQRGQGSMDFVATARSVIGVALDPDDREYSILAHIKASLSKPGPSLRFALEPTPNGGTVLVWDREAIAVTPEDLFAGQNEGGSSVEEAKRLLTQLGWSGEVTSKEIEVARKELNISERAMRRAKKELGVTWDRRGRNGAAGAGEIVLRVPTKRDDSMPGSTPVPSIRLLDHLCQVDELDRVNVQGDLPHGQAKNEGSENAGNIYSFNSYGERVNGEDDEKPLTSDLTNNGDPEHEELF